MQHIDTVLRLRGSARFFHCGDFGKLPIKARSRCSSRRADFRSEINRRNLNAAFNNPAAKCDAFTKYEGQCPAGEIVQINASLLSFAKPSTVESLPRIYPSIYLFICIISFSLLKRVTSNRQSFISTNVDRVLCMYVWSI